LKFLDVEAKSLPGKRRRTFNSFWGPVVLDFSWMFQETSRKVYPSGSENTYCHRVTDCRCINLGQAHQHLDSSAPKLDFVTENHQKWKPCYQQ
jgi:hypothetical protein